MWSKEEHALYTKEDVSTRLLYRAQFKEIMWSPGQDIIGEKMKILYRKQSDYSALANLFSGNISLDKFSRSSIACLSGAAGICSLPISNRLFPLTYLCKYLIRESEDILTTDALLRRESGVSSLNDEDLLSYCLQRGLLDEITCTITPDMINNEGEESADEQRGVLQLCGLERAELSRRLDHWLHLTGVLSRDKPPPPTLVMYAVAFGVIEKKSS
jgi:hypothetical protein